MLAAIGNLGSLTQELAEEIKPYIRRDDRTIALEPVIRFV
jgi:hypothetical protein